MEKGDEVDGDSKALFLFGKRRMYGMGGREADMNRTRKCSLERKRIF